MVTVELLEFDDLTPACQEIAVNQELEAILGDAVEFPRYFSDPLQTKLCKAHAVAEAMQTPWFAGEYIMESCGEELRLMALKSMKGVLYLPRSLGRTVMPEPEDEATGGEPVLFALIKRGGIE